LGYEACASINERLIYASGSTFGSEGPMAGRRGADLAGQAFGGLVAATGTVGQPSPVGVVAADSTAGLVLCNAILAALLARVQTERGQRVETSLYGGATWLGAAELTYALIADEQYPRFGGGHPSLSPLGLYGVYETADGHLALLGAGDEEWAAFLEALELTEIEADPRFADAMSRVIHAEELREVVRPRLLERDSADWATRLAAADVRFAPVQDYRMIAADEQASVMGYVRRFEREDGSSVQAVGNPIRMSETPVSPGARPPELGEHTEEVLLEAGYDWAEIGALQESGAI
jgi:crotonobetainyl-CoA:carnitine CoA-transferase CaiB-like acyl-CoA transferase